MSVFTGQDHKLDIAGFPVRLPIVRIKPDFAISLMMIIDMGIAFGTHCGNKLGETFAAVRPEIVVGPATLGIPLAMEVSRARGLDDYLILQKSPKLHLADALKTQISSITSSGSQSLLLDARRKHLVEGRRVLLVDDVIASGGSMAGALSLLRQAGANVVGIGVVLTEAYEWKQKLGPDAALVRGLAHIPQFYPVNGSWQAIPETF